MTDFESEIEQMKKMALFLLPYSKTKEDKADFSWMTTREMTVCGYKISFYLTVERHPECDIWTLQMYSKYQPFIPFWLVCKCAASFLGDRELGLTEYIILGRKLYVWSVALDTDGNPIPIPPRPNIEAKCYDGFEYIHAPAAKVLLLPS
jgi:hypothetical protein